MNYFEARGSGKPFNRKKYKDDWYIYDQRRNLDFSRVDLSQRFWTSDDLNADDWWTVEMHNAELGMSDQDREAFEKWCTEKFNIAPELVEEFKHTFIHKLRHTEEAWQAAVEYKQKDLNEVELREISVNRSFVDLARKFVELQKAFDDRVRVIEMQLEDKKKLKREIEVLRLYGNKDCTAMADEVLENE